MGNGLASKLIYYWIFVLGGLTISYLMKFLTEGADFVIMLIVLTLVYWGIEFMKFKKNQRGGQQPAQAGKSKAASRKKR
jgi:cytochrome c biogenesis protein CcdA